MPLFCNISGIGVHKITGTTFLIVVDELHRGCKSVFCNSMLIFYKIGEVFRIRTCGPYSEHPKCKKKGAKQPRRKFLLSRFAPDFKRKHSKCHDTRKKYLKKSTSTHWHRGICKNRSELGTPTLYKICILSEN